MHARSLPALISISLALGCGSSTTGSTGPSSHELDSDEKELLFEVNRLREGAGIPGALIVCNALNESASLHSDDMRDKGYVAEKAPDGTQVRDRACKAGYEPGCGNMFAMAELVAAGISRGEDVVKQWAQRDDAKGVLLNTQIVAAGAGRSLDGDGEAKWTLDLGGRDDPSCQ